MLALYTNKDKFTFVDMLRIEKRDIANYLKNLNSLLTIYD